MREVPFGLDADFSRQAIVGRINSDLANDLGNLFSRVIAMVHKYFNGDVPQGGSLEASDAEIKDKQAAVLRAVAEYMNQLAFNRALTAIWELISLLNKYIDDTAPWVLAKDAAKKERLATVMRCLLEALRLVAVLLWPFMPASAERMWEAIGGRGTHRRTEAFLCRPVDDRSGRDQNPENTRAVSAHRTKQYTMNAAAQKITAEKNRSRVFTIPNLLTLFRIVVTPLFFILFYYFPTKVFSLLASASVCSGIVHGFS